MVSHNRKLSAYTQTVQYSTHLCILLCHVRLDLSPRPATASINMPADSGDSIPLIFALLCLHLLPHTVIFLRSLPLSAPVCSDTARLKKH